MNTKGKGRVNKGAPSGLVISLLFHAAAFFIAGLFVVFTVVNKKRAGVYTASAGGAA